MYVVQLVGAHKLHQPPIGLHTIPKSQRHFPQMDPTKHPLSFSTLKINVHESQGSGVELRPEIPLTAGISILLKG